MLSNYSCNLKYDDAETKIIFVTLLHVFYKNFMSTKI